MFSLTPKERKVLIFIGLLILIGSILRFFNVCPVRDNPSQGFDVCLRQTISNGVNEKVSPEFSSNQLPININKASQKELERIPGIGEVIARRIIDYRNQYGEFKTPEDLRKVKGIGEKKLQAIKDCIEF